MARNPRLDEPGSWHHVMNRGIARRSLFETSDDIRSFLSGLARAVRRGQLEVHAWCVLTTHYHLLVRSPAGQLSDAMRRIQNAYVRKFNRERKRDGPLVRGRFRSRRVRSYVYRCVLVRYIDVNPVRAGLVERASDYVHGSARAYSSSSGPPWLTRSWVEELVCRRLGLDAFVGERYSEAFPGTLANAALRLADRRISSSSDSESVDELDDLVGAAPETIRRWLRRKAMLADGTSPGLALADPAAVLEAIAAWRERDPSWWFAANRRKRCGWEPLAAGLLRELTAATFGEIATRIGGSVQTATRSSRQHRQLLLEDPDYGRAASVVVQRALPSFDTGPGARAIAR